MREGFVSFAVAHWVIGQSVGQVFLKESAAAKAGGKNLAILVEALFNRMITIGTLPFALLVIVSSELFVQSEGVTSLLAELLFNLISSTVFNQLYYTEYCQQFLFRILNL